MKKLCILFLLSTLLSCAKYPHIPYLVGESHFNIDTIKRMAPYKKSNDVLTENEYAIYNIPPNISGVNKRKDWGDIVGKYNADLTYFYAIKDDNIYICIGMLLYGKVKKTRPPWNCLHFLFRWRRHTTHVIARICNPCPQSTSRKVTHSKLKKVKNNSKLRNMSTKYKATATAEA